MSLPAGWKSHLDELADCQPWPRYYHFRAAEMDLVQALCPLPRGGTMLELGCGNAFHSYLLSARFDLVIATDLDRPDPATHTIGLDRARALGRILSFRSLRLAAASAEALPLADGSIDFVFSSNVLEHVPRQCRAVREIHRVLKPGGQCLTVVPAAMERVYNFPISYVQVAASMLRGVRKHRRERGIPSARQSPEAASGTGAAAPGNGFLGKARRFFRVHYPGFPFPKPHGEYRSSTEELLAHRPARWVSLFSGAGFRIQQTFTTILAPNTLGMAVSPALAYWIARAGWPLTRRLGGMPFFRSVGTSFAILAVRDSEERK
ncbi:MAG: class I SAM-dependent methyltransferase [Acidobacteriota bacterium]